jgi:surface protein
MCVFASATDFNQNIIGGWNTGKVANMRQCAHRDAT